MYLYIVYWFRGLGIETVFVNILKVYLDPGNLVIVLGTTDHDERYFIDKLQDLGTKNLPRIVTGQCTSNERYIVTYRIVIFCYEKCIL